MSQQNVNEFLSTFGSRPALCVCPPERMSHVCVLFFAIPTISPSAVHEEGVERELRGSSSNVYSPTFFLSSPSYHRGELFFVLLHRGGSVAKLQRPAALSDHLEHGG